MSDEQTPDPATLAPMELRKLAKVSRRGFRESEGGELARAVLGAVKIRRQMRDDGASVEECDKYLEGVLRASWPKGRVETWHYMCQECRDTGLVMHECTPTNRCDGISTRVDHPKDKPGKYQRLCVRDPTYSHDYGVPCHYCERGSRFRQNSTTTVHDVTSLGRGRRKPQGPSRFGE